MDSPFFNVSLFQAFLQRRSRRVALGISIPEGPVRYRSAQKPVPLTEEEEAALAFAACGITGAPLADLSYGPGQGGTMIAGRCGRTIPSPDAINTVTLIITNDHATYLLRRPQDFPPSEIPELIRLASARELLELFRRTRIKIKDGRAAPPLDAKNNFSINRFSLYREGTSYFLPVIETTALTINALLELFDEHMGIFIRDERAFFRPAGLARFARSRGGHLHDDPHDLQSATIHAVELSLAESMATEQGMVLQNLGLAAEALGLGGFPNFARHENSWFEALNFRMGTMPASRYLGAPRIISKAAGWLRRDPLINYPLGLERDGSILLKPFCPPYYPNMEAAVRAFLDTKFGSSGIYAGGTLPRLKSPPTPSAPKIPPPSAAAIEATIAYCNYIFSKYGRFPAYSAAFRTIIGFQVGRFDPEFYRKSYNVSGNTPAP
jgi:hypothetical protein